MPGINWNCQVKRYYVVLMLSFAHFILQSYTMNLDFAVIVMKENRIFLVDSVQWDRQQENLLLASFHFGYAITNLTAAVLNDYIGATLVILIGAIGSSLSAFLTPIILLNSYIGLVLLRFISGLFQGLFPPAVVSIILKWAPSCEKTFLLGLSLSGSFLHLVVSLTFTMINRDLGWEWIFYIFGILSCCWVAIFFVTVSPSPSTDKLISKEEKSYIEESVGVITSIPVHPWRKILSSPCVWAIVVANFAYKWGVYTVLYGGLAFLVETLNVDYFRGRLYIEIGFVITSILVAFSPYISDIIIEKEYLKCAAVRKIFASTGLILQGLFFMVPAFAYDRLAVVAIIIATGLGGLSLAGFYPNALDIGGPHSPIITGVSEFISTIPAVAIPYITDAMIPEKNSTGPDWFRIWAMSSILHSSSGLIFAFFAKGELQSWVWRPEE